MASITFLMPAFQFAPVGGFKIVFDYANCLADDGHDVHIVYADSIKYRNKVPPKMAVKLYVKALLYRMGMKHRSARLWYPLRASVKEHNVYSLDYRYVPKTDLYVCTAVETSEYLDKYPVSADKKHYFVQGYEVWDRSDAEVRATYHYQMRKIVISEWLRHIVEDEEHEHCVVVPNGFDTTEYHLTVPIQKKDKYTVSILYHLSERKGCKYSFAALDMVKRRLPQLKVLAFGTPMRPDNLPDWYEYWQSPTGQDHLSLNNRAAVYVASSIEEGWGLTVGEAMMCGQAVACTDISGYREMATDGYNALLSPMGDIERLAANIIRLINDDEYRFKIAEHGLESMRRFSKEESYKKFKTALGLGA